MFSYFLHNKKKQRRKEKMKQETTPSDKIKFQMFLGIVVCIVIVLLLLTIALTLRFSKTTPEVKFWNVTYIYGDDNKTVMDYYLTPTSALQVINGTCRAWLYNATLTRYSCTKDFAIDVYNQSS